MTYKKPIGSVIAVASFSAALALLLIAGAVVKPAYAHAVNTETLTTDPVTGHQISVVLGHTNEPTYGAEPGINDGRHNVEVLLSDKATGLPLTGANLKIDKYYFNDLKSFQNANAVDNADSVKKGVVVGSIFGDPGHYMARQVQEPGIYGYRLYGTIDYFKVATISIDSTVFCKATDGTDTSKFNSPGWIGGYGCTENINDIFFPIENQDNGSDQFPTIHMEDKTTSSATPLFGTKNMDTEYVADASLLVGKRMDSMTVMLNKSGFPTGTVQVGVFGKDLSVKKLFGTMDASSLNTTPIEYTFSLSGSDLYQIKSGDYIGVKFTGGNDSNNVQVMRDANPSDPFDGTHSFRAFHNAAGWTFLDADDMYMVLKQKHG